MNQKRGEAMTNPLSLKKKPEGKKITVGSLFSGIGGIELGLERTGGFKTIWFCENDEYASAVLRKHWPEVPNLGDITEVDWDAVERPEMLTGGFPCQDISIAGRKKGIQADTRSGLWHEYFRAISALRPGLALIENVPELANNGLDIILSDLASIGYDAEWNRLSACQCGATHPRFRLFTLAYPMRNGWKFQLCEGRNDSEEGKQVEETKQPKVRTGGFWSNPRTSGIAERMWRVQRKEWLAEPDVGRVAHGVSNRVDRIKCLGNAVVPQVAQVVGEMILECKTGVKP